ncbi:MAG: hypothetical protein PVH24_03645 [Candidatus Zixiibacteriota bacterium]|jgi:hypothetical protein
MCAVVCTVLSLAVSSADEVSCDFNSENPRVLHAKVFFTGGQYACAEQELKAVLAKPDITSHTAADAHMLLAAVYFQTVSDREVRRQRTREQFIQGLRADRKWSGNLAVSSAEFITIFNDARELVEWLYKESPELFASDSLAEEQVTEAVARKKPWYKRWWALASGVGVAVLAGAIILGGGNNGSEPPPAGDTLPEFPPTPN